jgi:hypothetical protein
LPKFKAAKRARRGTGNGSILIFLKVFHLVCRGLGRSLPNGDSSGKIAQQHAMSRAGLGYGREITMRGIETSLLRAASVIALSAGMAMLAPVHASAQVDIPGLMFGAMSHGFPSGNYNYRSRRGKVRESRHERDRDKDKDVKDEPATNNGDQANNNNNNSNNTDRQQESAQHGNQPQTAATTTPPKSSDDGPSFSPSR